MPKTDILVETVTLFVKNSVKKTEAVKVTNVQGSQIQIIEVSVDPSDAGLIIGKGGRKIKALRTVVSILSKGKARVNLVNLPPRSELKN